MQKTYDVIVAGAGPGGSTCAAFLGNAGRKVLLLDRAKFPRDKTCGDAISGSLRTQEKLNLTPVVKKNPHAVIRRVIFSSPNGKELDVKFSGIGYTCRRQVYDNIIFQKAKKHADVIEEFTVTGLIKEDGYVKGITGKDKKGAVKEFRANVIVGADGAQSVVARETGCLDLDPKHTITAVRAYYGGVKGMKDQIELHFVNDIIPGYFWIFAMEDGNANVGLGMVVSDFKKKKWKMTDKMFEIVEKNPLFRERFKDAKLEKGSVKGWTLPVGSKRRKARGNGFVLIGDAAGLIDPFTGEGISNAMKSGEIAAGWIDKALEAGDFSDGFLRQYEDNIWGLLGKRLMRHYRMQKLGKRKFLVNLIVNKASKSKQIYDTLRVMVDNTEERKGLTNPLFYLKLLFA